MSGETPSPSVPAGWYPDPTQPGTQRYWDGSQWTEHRAPLSPAPASAPPAATGTSSWSLTPSPRLIIALLGVLAAVIAIFLPHTESSEVLTIANNTLLANGDGILVVILALAAGAMAVRHSGKPDVSWPLVVIGALTIGLALFDGTGQRLEVVNGLGETVESKAGSAIWALGIGGALITLAGFLQPQASAPAGRPG
jgi:hypothetical protein